MLSYQMVTKQYVERYPLVNFHITMENHHFQWENPL